MEGWYGSQLDLTNQESRGAELRRYRSESDLATDMPPPPAPPPPLPLTSPVPPPTMVPPPVSTEKTQVTTSIDNSSSSQSPVSMEIGTDKQVGSDLGTAYHQCSAARNASQRTVGVNMVLNVETPFGTTAFVDSDRVGTLDGPEKTVLRTFHGARATVNGGTVNQSVTLSFDPNSFVCLSFSSEHPICESKKPAVFV